MRGGLLRHRVKIEAAQASTDSFGQSVNAYGLFTVCWAAVEPLAGDERETAEQFVAGVTHRVRIRWIDGLPVRGRVLHRGRYLEIKAALDVMERRREAHLLCVELVDAAPEETV